jgi:hypothetical protein
MATSNQPELSEAQLAELEKLEDAAKKAYKDALEKESPPAH